MKGKTFGILLVAAALLVGLALLRQGADKPADDIKMGAELFADLPVNDVASVTIANAEDQVTLARGQSAWQVQSRSGYPADFDALRDTVVNLSRLKVGRTFDGTQDSFARLSLLPPTADAETGRGTAVTLKDANGKVLADVILGQVRDTEGGGSGGQYLKRGDADTVYLVDGNFRFLKVKPADWLEKDILDIKGDDVRAVACYTGDGEAVYQITRPAAGDAAVLENVPAGRQADTAKIDQVMDAMGPLTLDDVSRADGPPPTDAMRLVYQLYDGREITLYPGSGDGNTYTIRVAAAELPIAARENGEAADEGPDGGEAEAEENPGTDDPATDAGTNANPAVKTAQEINDDLGPWVFTIKKWQHDSFITDPEALLAAPETPSETAS